MSTWISRARRASALILGLAIGPGWPGTASADTRGPDQVAVAGGAVSVAGPNGFCVDTAASRSGSLKAFVLFLPCAKATEPAILTASVLTGGPADQPSAVVLPAMAAFFRSDAGRAALSRSGRAHDVRITDMRSVGPVLYLRLSDRSAAQSQPVDPDYWRAVMLVKGRIVTLSVLALAERPLNPDARRRLLETFVARVRRANGLQ